MRRIAALLLALLLCAGCESAARRPADPVPRNSYDPDAFAVSGGYLTYGAGVSHVGVDVSSHQGEIDWQAAADSGVEFAMIRAGYRGYTEGGLFEDACFAANMDGALAAGLEVGVYFFSQALTEEEALEEADFLLSLIDGCPITYPVVFDWERQSAETSRTREADGAVITACAAAFCSAVEAAGYLPMVYFSPSKAYGELDLSALTAWPFWLAHYTADYAFTTFRYHFSMWQYTSTGSVPGIRGNVDLDLALTDFSPPQDEAADSAAPEGAPSASPAPEHPED